MMASKRKNKVNSVLNRSWRQEFSCLSKCIA